MDHDERWNAQHQASHVCSNKMEGNVKARYMWRDVVLNDKEIWVLNKKVCCVIFNVSAPDKTECLTVFQLKRSRIIICSVFGVIWDTALPCWLSTGHYSSQHPVFYYATSIGVSDIVSKIIPSYWYMIPRSAVRVPGKVPVNPVQNSPSYLNIFGVQLFIQGKALHCALVTCMKGAKLDPLIGRVSVREQRDIFMKG